MKVGKVPENVLKRSVFKQIHTMRPEVVLGAGVGEDCAAVQLAEDETLDVYKRQAGKEWREYSVVCKDHPACGTI